MDKYDEAIEHLRKFYDAGELENIYGAWNYPDEENPASALFQYVANDGYSHPYCGCLTQVRSGYKGAYGSMLTDQIRADIRIPCRIPDPGDFNLGIEESKAQYKEELLPLMKALPVLAEWQRRLDVELKRV
jgi:hypothetical protein